jgi:cytochrome c oxidase subunit IV
MEHAADLHLDDTGHGEHGHPSVLFYNIIAIALFVITFVEVAILYPPLVHFGDYFKVLILIVLSVIKFGVVVAFFMHLFFDASLLTFLFGMGLVIGGGTVVGLYNVMPAAEHPLQPRGKQHAPAHPASHATPGAHAAPTEAAPATDHATPGGEATPAAEAATPAADAAPATDATPAADASPAADATPAADASPATDISPAATATP